MKTQIMVAVLSAFALGTGFTGRAELTYLGAYGTSEYWYESASTDFPAAQAAAAELGGKLVSITSEAESDFLIEALTRLLLPNNPPRAAYIGLFRQSQSAPWQWESGEAVDYTNWRLEWEGGLRFPEPTEGRFGVPELAAVMYVYDSGIPVGRWADVYGTVGADSFPAIYEVENRIRTVRIDIKPGSWPNAINLGSLGVVPVAIFSDAGFDATKIDPETVVLAGAGVAVRGKGSKYLAHAEDVDADGLPDLVCQVVTENFDPELLQDGHAVLYGETWDGTQVMGADEIVLVPKEQ
jgi:hypothetical protein